MAEERTESMAPTVFANLSISTSSFYILLRVAFISSTHGPHFVTSRTNPHIYSPSTIFILLNSMHLDIFFQSKEFFFFLKKVKIISFTHCQGKKINSIHIQESFELRDNLLLCECLAVFLLRAHLSLMLLLHK